jgi:hypothetical protein
MCVIFSINFNDSLKFSYISLKVKKKFALSIIPASIVPIIISPLNFSCILSILPHSTLLQARPLQLKESKDLLTFRAANCLRDFPQTQQMKKSCLLQPALARRSTEDFIERLLINEDKIH